VNQPALLAVDRHHGAATTRIERQIHPARLTGQHAHQLGRAEIGGLHALHHWDAGKFRANPMADDRPAAVAADEIAAGDGDTLAAVEVANNASHPLLVLAEFLELVAIEDADAWLRRGVREQQRFKEKLVDPVWPLRRWPRTVIALLAADATGA
jgi:hypothetical protein